MADQLTRGGPALHRQIADILRKGIRAGELRQGMLLPPEARLAERYGVSRPVVRQAMQALTVEGLITRTAGKGTFVRGPERARFAGWSITSVEQLVSSGRGMRFELLSQRELPVTPAAADALDLAGGTPVVEIRGLRFSDEGVVVYQQSFVLLDLGRAILGADLKRHTVLSAIEERCGIIVDRVLQAITAIAAGADGARLLAVPDRSPLLQVERLVVSRERGAVLFGISQYRCDRYRHIAELTRMSDGG